ncbi:MAG: DEAD/DEAH box helicase family protein [Phycisphaeraceae bacterium]|nr:MAG: DEAD/DEAH box helicase family protein [Phycisphaeraceae bacterium]
MLKRTLTETEICDQFITPALVKAGWEHGVQIRREYTFTDGQVIVRGKLAKRGDRKRADYILQHHARIPLAVIEAKDNTHSVGSGLQQALAYAKALDIPFAFSSNGDAFVFHDRTGLSNPVERQISLSEFPTPDELWARYRAWKGITDDAERLVRHPFHDDGTGKEPRYYQRIAIQRTIEAIANQSRRVLLVMATGTGKTYTAFQIIWRLWKAGRVKRVLFLADRNILVDQTKTKDFKPFGQVMTKVQNRTIDKSFEIYLALYQAVSGTEEAQNVYKEFSRDFFDLIVIDECHRGSAREDSAWREILDYFHPAIHLGLTATPKETNEVSTLTYFGEPVYTYSLKEGIADGFLAPYKVIRIDLDRDLQGWRPPKGMLDDTGQLIEDRIYNLKDMDRALVLNARTRVVARKICDYLAETDPYGKTIVFCEDIDHAERMRSALVNEIGERMPEERDNLHRFVMRITGDNDEGKRALDDFIHPEKRYPVIATTSKLLTTGVDAQTCRLIVIDQTIESMIEFKQIIGRGTRIHEDTNKLWFTIMDFKKATELFADPDFDGDPIVIIDENGERPPRGRGPGSDEGEPGEDEDLTDSELDGDDGEGEGRVKYIVSGVAVAVLAERVQYYGPDGRLITESITDYTRSAVNRNFESMHDFLNRWTSAEKKQAIVDELAEKGVLFHELQKLVGEGYDPFDLICRVVYDRPALTRKERAMQVRKRDVFTKYGEQARAVLNALLDKYADEGVFPEDIAVLRNIPFNEIGTPLEIIQQFGGKDGFLAAIKELERELYRDAG